MHCAKEEVIATLSQDLSSYQGSLTGCIYFSKSELNLLYEFCGRLLWQWDEVKNQAAGDFSDSCWREQLIRWSHHLWNRNSDDNCEHWAAALLRGVASGGEELCLARGDVETILGPTDIAVRSLTCWTLATRGQLQETQIGNAKRSILWKELTSQFDRGQRLKVIYPIPKQPDLV